MRLLGSLGNYKNFLSGTQTPMEGGGHKLTIMVTVATCNGYLGSTLTTSGAECHRPVPSVRMLLLVKTGKGLRSQSFLLGNTF